MEKTSADQYGRKKWNLEAYENEVKRGQKRPDASNEAKAAAVTYNEASALQHRASILDKSVQAVSQHTLISGENNTSATYGKNKRFGFICPICDLSFRDTLALVDHINSPQHARNAQRIARLAGQSDTDNEISFGVKHATPEEVAMTVETLVAKTMKDRLKSTDLGSIQERIKKRQAFIEQRATKRREKRREKRQKLDNSNMGEDDQIKNLMGFGGFGSTKT